MSGWATLDGPGCGGQGAPIVGVSGGAGGFAANYDDLLWLAQTFEQHAGQLTQQAQLGARVVADPELVESALLAPDSFAEAELCIVQASTGLDGVLLRALELEADAMLIRASVVSYQLCDGFVHDLLPRLEAEVGYVAAEATLRTASAHPLITAGAGGSAYLTWVLLPADAKAELSQDLVDQIHANPVLAEHLIAAGGGFVGGLYDGTIAAVPGGARGVELATGYDLPEGRIGAVTTSEASRHLARLFGNDSDVVVSENRPGVPAPAPADVPGVLDRLAEVNKRGEGEIEVQKLAGGRAIVYLPGTDDLNPLPPGDSTVRDMETNYQSIGQLDSGYRRGIVEAMRQAGLQGSQSVMLVGHSQGGMIAAQIAADPALAAEFKITQVMTAGSATAMVDELPGDVRLLNLRNQGDLVPMLDGEADPDQENRLTVTFDVGAGSINEMHSLEAYRRGAIALESSGHLSVTSMLADIRRDGFVGGRAESVQSFTITRR